MDQQGNVTMNNANIRDILQAADWRGDIYRKGYYLQPIIQNVIIGGSSQEHEFFRINLGIQLFAQRVVLNNTYVPF